MIPKPDRIITRITIADTDSRHKAITHLGNPAEPWMWTMAAVIRSIEAKAAGFFIVINGRQSDVGIVRPKLGLPYLQAFIKGKWNQDLLAVKNCIIPA